jgi:hypothetical protein
MPLNRRHRVGFASELLREREIYGLRFEAAEDLLDEGARLFDETGRTENRRARLLLTAQAARCIHIFESVIALCRIGRGVPASMLNRALLDEALDAYWISANPDIAPVRADEHERAVKLGERGVQQPFNASEPPMTEIEEAELQQARRRYRDFKESWTLATFPERFALLKASWDDEADHMLDYVYEVMQRQNSVLVHPSPSGYGLAMTPGRRHPNRIGPDEFWAEALKQGCLGFYLVLRVLASEFDLDRSAVEACFVQASCFMLRFTDDELRAIPDGKPCPCRSGRPVERCHRA